MSENKVNNIFFEQIDNLTSQIDSGNGDADCYYQRGRLYWKIGKHGAAMSDYEFAISLDPNSPAKEALRISNEIMDFYNTDLYNP